MRKLKEPEGVTPLDVFISSIRKERTTSSPDGSNYTYNHGYVYKDRDITLTFLMEAKSNQAYTLMRDEVYKWLDNSTGATYLSEVHQQGKRYLVVIDEPFIPEMINGRVATVEVKCTKIGLPFGESIITSAYIDKNRFKYNVDSPLTHGLGFSNHENEYIYSNTFKNFRIFNAGTADNDLFEQDLRIEITGASGSTFTLKNKTTGELFKVNVPVKSTDRIEIQGARILINSTNALRKTNRQFISLNSGWNEFEMSSNAKTFFDFRFYYK